MAPRGLQGDTNKGIISWSFQIQMRRIICGAVPGLIPAVNGQAVLITPPFPRRLDARKKDNVLRSAVVRTGEICPVRRQESLCTRG